MQHSQREGLLPAVAPTLRATGLGISKELPAQYPIRSQEDFPGSKAVTEK